MNNQFLDSFAAAFPGAMLLPLGVLIVLGILALLLSPRKNRKSNRADGTKRINVTDPKVQLDCVRSVGFRPRPLLNASETKVFAILERTLRERDTTLRLMAQTSLGEILEPTPKSGSAIDLDNARRSINSKRIDFAVFGVDHRPLVAIEYQGAGHFRGNAPDRDAVKREVFARAGVPFVEILQNDSDNQISAALRAALDTWTSARPDGNAAMGNRASRLTDGTRPEPVLTRKGA